jgi:hypothetical protein
LQLALGGLTLVVTNACARVPEHAAALPTPTTTPDLDSWRTKALTMLADGLQTLRTFEVFAAYRVSITADSGRRSASELLWDPPTGADWDAATHLAHGLRGQADQLFQAITTTQQDPSVWREQRALADAVHDIGDVGDALGIYRDRLNGLRPGDASGALPLLDDAWAKWQQTADRLGLGRAESVGCGS